MITCVFRLFAICALAVLSFMVFFVDVAPSTSLAIEHWINSRWSTLTSVGTLLLVGFFTVFATQLANSAAEKREKNNRRIAVELKKAEFRQVWINDMRADLAEYSALHWSAELQGGPEEKRHAIALQARILMRMNPEDPDYDALVLSLMNPVADQTKGRQALAIVGQKFLKREWGRLKDDLDAIDGALP